MFEQDIATVVIGFFSALTAWFFARKTKAQELRSKEVEIESLKVQLESKLLDNEIKSATYYQGLLDDMSKRLDKAIEELMASEERHRKLMDINRRLVETNEYLVNEIKKFKQLNGKVDNGNK